VFTVFLAFVGREAMRRYGLRLDRPRMEGAPCAVAMAIMLVLAALSVGIGLGRSAETRGQIDQ
jgi:Kef-type K+ transport system membrane component KefB